MRKEHYWNVIRYALLAVFSVVIIIGIGWIYRDFRQVQEGADLSDSEKAFDIKGEYLHDKNVLVISSYNPTYMIVPEEEDGIYDTLKAAGIGYEIDYMNYKELGSREDYEETFYQSLKAHLDYHTDGREFSAVMAGDDDALRFCMKYKEELFPGLPVVFYAVNDIPYAKECVKDPLVAGSIEKTYLQETITLALQMVPDVDEFIMIRDDTPTCLGDWENLQELSRNYEGIKLSDINTQAMSTQEFCDRISHLNDRAIVLASVALKDPSGHVMSLMQRFNMIRDYANVPVFTCYMHGIGNGATAGDAMYMRDCGETAAKQVVQILNNGVSPSEIPLHAEGFHRVAIDEAMMIRNHLSLDDIPDNALILNKTPSFWDTYRQIMIPMFMIIGSLVGILILLVIDGLYVRGTKKDIEYQNSILDAISHEFISLWYVNAEDHTYRLIRNHGASDMAKTVIDTTRLGVNYEEGMDWFIDHFVLEEDQEEMRKQVSIPNLLQNTTEKEIYRVNFRLSRESEGVRYCQVGYARTSDADGNVHFAAGFHNVDEDTRRQIRQEQDLETAWKHAHIDNMTGMLNRRAYEEKLREIRDLEPSYICVINMDVNGLKEVNDHLGHQEGDHLIRGAAEIISEVIGKLGTCYRTGGDEFVAIVLDTDISEQEIRDRIQAAVKEWKGNFSEKLAISIGMAKSTADQARTVEELLKTADDNMYADKKAFYNAKGNDRRQRRSDLTRNELATRISYLRSMFENVRVIDLKEHSAIRYDENGKEYHEHIHCFETWDKTGPCENCISAKAMQDHGRHSKFEKRGSDTFFVTSQYMNVDGREVLLEVIQKIEQVI